MTDDVGPNLSPEENAPRAGTSREDAYASGGSPWRPLWLASVLVLSLGIAALPLI